MTEKPKSGDPPKPPLPKKTSGEYPAVQHMRAKMESYSEHQIADLIALEERTQKMVSKIPSKPPSGPLPDAYSAPTIVTLPEDLPTVPDEERETPVGGQPVAPEIPKKPEGSE